MIFFGICLLPWVAASMKWFSVVEVENNQTYLVSELYKTIRKIPDVQTLEYIGFSSDDVKKETLSSLVDHYSIKSDIPRIEQINGTPDEVLRCQLLKILCLQENLWINLELFSYLINPSIVKIRNRLLTCAGNAWPTIDIPSATEFLYCKWFNYSLYPFYSNDVFYGISSTEYKFIDIPILGQDPRLVSLNDDHVRVSYTFRFSKYVRMGYAEWQLNASNAYTTIEHVQTIIPLPEHTASDHKNWSPFIYQFRDHSTESDGKVVTNELLIYYIISINPLQIVTTETLSTESESHIAKASIVSVAPTVNLEWNYGHLRGGTNAVRLSNCYLALFHSSTFLPGNLMKTYFMGAYTFTIEPPFRLLSISPVPIVNLRLYEGPWSLFKNRMNDYVIFPSSLVVEGDGDDATIIVSLGHNDQEGWIGTMNLNTLIYSLVPIN